MTKGRLEAFSDGVIAIIITIMVLEFQVPHEATLEALRPLIPIFLSYVLSFVYIGIYWNNHHHLFHAVQQVNGRALWVNLHLLFWLSLVPFATAWLDESQFSLWPTALYGIILLMAGLSYFILSRVLLAQHSADSALATALGQDYKGRLSLLIYIVAIALAFVNPQFSLALYVLVALMWFIPDWRIEKEVTK
jgi:uncharacterized membrane protein